MSGTTMSHLYCRSSSKPRAARLHVRSPVSAQTQANRRAAMTTGSVAGKGAPDRPDTRATLS